MSADTLMKSRWNVAIVIVSSESLVRNLNPQGTGSNYDKNCYTGNRRRQRHNGYS